MTLEATLVTCVQRIATEFRTVYSQTGSLASLNTTTKTSLVAAINEVLAGIGTVQGNLNTELTTRLAALKAEILGGASAAYDTLMELQQFLQSNDSQISALLTAIGNRVRFDATQTLSVEQQLVARTNIGAVGAIDLGNLGFNCVAIFEAALVA